MSRVSIHVAPDENDIERNKSAEPEGERLRAELTEWLRKNGIVSMMLDTPEHCVEVRIAPRLPPRIKPVLTLWGSIYVRDAELPDKPDAQEAGGVVIPNEEPEAAQPCSECSWREHPEACPTCKGTGVTP
jgi:hypothetical protein